MKDKTASLNPIYQWCNEKSREFLSAVRLLRYVGEISAVTENNKDGFKWFYFSVVSGP